MNAQKSADIFITYLHKLLKTVASFSLHRLKSCSVYISHGQFQKQYFQPDAKFCLIRCCAPWAAPGFFQNIVKIKSQLGKFVFDFEQQLKYFAFCVHRTSFVRFVQWAEFKKLLYGNKAKAQMLRKKSFHSRTILKLGMQWTMQVFLEFSPILFRKTQSISKLFNSDRKKPGCTKFTKFRQKLFCRLAFARIN